MLTQREIQISTKLLDMEKALRTKDLSKQLNVSTRTIKSDLEKVRIWFEENNIEFCSQPNKGFWIKASKNERVRVYQLLMDLENQPEYFDAKLRIEKIFYLFYS